MPQPSLLPSYLLSPLSRANKQRSVSSTNLNSVSSRSHAILTIHVTVVDSDQNLSQYRPFLQCDAIL